MFPFKERKKISKTNFQTNFILEKTKTKSDYYASTALQARKQKLCFSENWTNSIARILIENSLKIIQWVWCELCPKPRVG